MKDFESFNEGKKSKKVMSDDDIVKVIKEVTGQSLIDFLDDMSTALDNLNAYEHDFESELSENIDNILRKIK